MIRSALRAGVLVGGFVVALSTPSAAQNAADYTPPRLADGQPDITGMWNNSRAMFTPLELPEALAGKELSADELQARAEARGAARIAGSEWKGHENSRGVGGYGTYWFDWYWETPNDIGQASIIVDPPNGRIPPRTANARESVAMNLAELHDAAGNMESGDRCISRGVLGMMMPTEYNNGTLILQSPGYVTIHSEMIHNVRIIPIDVPHADTKVKQWEGDPRGRWEGNTLIVESTNFKAIKNIRGPTAGTRSRQSEKQHMVERFTVVGPDEIRYSVTMDDEDTYTAPWTAAFPFNRDDEYLQFEYACHEGNYSVPNALGGARQEEAGQ
jgi:hypothetical protein